MADKPLVSVIIATFNCAQYLPYAIESVLNQTYLHTEIIVVNDGSTDETDRVMALFGSNVIYKKQNNQGPGAARNSGIQISKGKYILFLDADDLLKQPMLEVMVENLEAHPGVDIAFCNGCLLEFIGDEWLLGKTFSETGYLDMGLSNPEQSLPVLLSHNAFPLHAGVVRRETVLNVGGFDVDRRLMVFADWDLWYRIAENHHFQYIDQDLVIYRIFDKGISHDLQKLAEACRIMEMKILKTRGFVTAKPREKSEFYFELGKLILRAGCRTEALRFFRMALAQEPRYYKIWAAYPITYILGNRALLVSGRLIGIWLKITRMYSIEHAV